MRYFRIVWVLVSVLLLVVATYTYDPVTGRDAEIVLIYGMLVLAFPSSVAVAAVFAALAYVDHISGLEVLKGYDCRLAIIVDWIAFVTVGYLQWFKVVPYLAPRIFRRRYR
jgi:hypothetical protein